MTIMRHVGDLLVNVFGIALFVWICGLGTVLMLVLATLCFVSAFREASIALWIGGFLCLVLAALSWGPGYHKESRDP
jgi:hypothetical protein